MKVSCQSCGANYNLPDDKVRGKKAKVRCKKCGANIIVDGTSQAVSPEAASLFQEEDEATRVMDMPARPTEGALWTINLSDEDQREMTREEIVAGWLDKTVNDDAYVWKDGMEEWLPILSSELAGFIREVDPAAGKAQASAVANPIAAPAASAPLRAESPSSLRNEVPQATLERPQVAAAPSVAAKSSPFASKAKTQTAAGKRPSVTAGLFGPLPEKGAKAGSLKAPVRAPSVPPPAPKTAENSVMFSLDALKAAAAVEPRSPIRELDTRVSEDLLTMGGPSGYELNPLPLIQIDAPVPVPAVAAPQVSLATQPAAPKSSSLNTILMVLGGLGVIGAVFFGVRSAVSPSASVPLDAPAVSAAPGEVRRAAAATSDDAPQATAEATAAPNTTAEPAAKPNAVATSVAPQAAAAHAAPKAAAVAAAPKTGGSKPEGNATPAKPAKSEAGGGGGGGKAFDVGAAKDALGAASSQAKLCKTGDGPTGNGKVQVTFAPSGRVTSANVQGPPFAGTSVGGCVARAFRSARIPAFDGSPQTVSKGFSIN